jgi:hypothetical protein
MNYGLEQPKTAPQPIHLFVKLLMVTITGLMNLLFSEEVGRAVAKPPIWSFGLLLLGIIYLGVMIAMNRALLWKWTCEKSWKKFLSVFLFFAVLPASLGFYAGLKGLWH